MVIWLFCCVVVEQPVHSSSIKMCSVHAEHHKCLVERFGRRLSLADAQVKREIGGVPRTLACFAQGVLWMVKGPVRWIARAGQPMPRMANRPWWQLRLRSSSIRMRQQLDRVVNACARCDGNVRWFSCSIGGTIASAAGAVCSHWTERRPLNPTAAAYSGAGRRYSTECCTVGDHTDKHHSQHSADHQCRCASAA